MNLSTAWVITGIIVAVLLMGMLSFIGSAHANPYFVGSKAATATASSTQASIPVGLGTTTVVYDSYEAFGTNETNQGNLTIPNAVALALNGRASSTATVVNIACEYSDNWNGTNGDWYQNDLAVATSTPLDVSVPLTISFKVSTSTLGGVTIPTSGSFINFQKMVTCPIQTRFVRAVITTTGANAMLYAQWLPEKQRNGN